MAIKIKKINVRFPSHLKFFGGKISSDKQLNFICYQIETNFYDREVEMGRVLTLILVSKKLSRTHPSDDLSGSNENNEFR